MNTAALLWEDSPVPRYVYAFDEPCDGGRELLGGKGAGLAEMTELGIPVPGGFTITTEACGHTCARGSSCRGLEGETAGRLEERTETLANRPTAPRVGALRGCLSMPGMMDTILNVA